jgi:creatinine amidohydrolase
MDRTVLWAKLNRTEFAAAIADRAVVVVPVGAMEQHAEHLPVDTDSTIGFELARHAALHVADFPVLVLPPLWTGYSPHHMGHHGSITLRFETLFHVLGEVAVSIAHHGFENILFLNAHGGNKPMVSGLRHEMRARHGIEVFGVNYWEIPGAAAAMKADLPADGGRLGHSGEMETSLQLWLDPDRVDRARARWVPGATGDASAGSREKGERLFAALVAALADFLGTIRDGGLRRGFEDRPDIGRP